MKINKNYVRLAALLVCIQWSAQVFAGGICDPNSPALTQADLLSSFAPGASTATLKGTWSFDYWGRHCNTLTGCTDWVESDPNWTVSAPDPMLDEVANPTKTIGGISAFVWKGSIYLSLSADVSFAGVTAPMKTLDANLITVGDKYFYYDKMQPLTLSADTQQISFSSDPQYTNRDSGYMIRDVQNFGESSLAPSGIVRQHCFLFSGDYATFPRIDGTYNEVRYQVSSSNFNE